MSLVAGVPILSSLVASVTFVTPHVNYVAILPELILIGGALVLLVSGQLVFAKVPTAFYSVGSGAVAAAALAASLVLWHDVQARGPFTAIADSVAVDGFAIVFLVLVSCILILGSVIANDFLIREGTSGPEYHVLALLAGSGAMLMASANDLILIFVALEIMSIPLYVLAGMDLKRRESGEAAMKYFVLGAFSSAIFVYGIALVYGATGSVNLPQIASYLSSNFVMSNGVLLAGLGLLLVGFGFKVSAVPFHMWTPDVYQGAPTPVTGFMIAIAKAGGFAALLRVFFSTFGTLRTDWQPLLWVIAIVTLLLGAIGGLVQHDVKRMLAYSSINHAGFILVGLAAATAQGISGSVYYVFVYAFLVLGETSSTTSMPIAASVVASRHWPSRSPCCSSARPGSRSRRAFWPSCTLYRPRCVPIRTRLPSSPCCRRPSPPRSTCASSSSCTASGCRSGRGATRARCRCRSPETSPTLWSPLRRRHAGRTSDPSVCRARRRLRSWSPSRSRSCSGSGRARLSTS